MILTHQQYLSGRFRTEQEQMAKSNFHVQRDAEKNLIQSMHRMIMNKKFGNDVEHLDGFTEQQLNQIKNFIESFIST